jgi:hypothetical protein
MKIRKRRRLSTRSIDHDAMVWPIASAIKTRAIKLMVIEGMPTPRTRKLSADAGPSTKQLTRLMPTTAAQGSTCQARSSNASSKSALANSQNTTTFPVDSAISGARHGVSEVGNPAAELTACAADPKAKAMARRPGDMLRKSRNSNAASSSSNDAVPARKARSSVGSNIKTALIAGFRWFYRIMARI